MDGQPMNKATELFNAEKLIIGLLLKDNTLAYHVGELEPVMFSDSLLGKMYKTILRSVNNSTRINGFKLAGEMQSEKHARNEIDKVIAECVMCADGENDLAALAESIIDDWTVRAARGYIKIKDLKSKSDVKALVANLENIIGEEKTSFKTLGEIVDENRKKIFTENRPERITMGFPMLDKLIGGIAKGDVAVVGARSSVGKSAFVSQIISNISADGKRVGLYNLEMHEAQIYFRLLSLNSGVTLDRIKYAKSYIGEERAVIEKGNKLLSDRNVFIKSSGARTASAIKSECRYMDFDILIIDYLGLLSPDSKYSNNRAAEVGNISKSIKAMAMELNLPVILLSQLNRESERAASPEPAMSNLRESGDIEQDASIVILIWNTTKEPTLKGVKVAKNRDGELGTVFMSFDGSRMKFTEIDKEKHDEIKNNISAQDKSRNTDDFYDSTDYDEIPFK